MQTPLLILGSNVENLSNHSVASQKYEFSYPGKWA